MDVQISPDSEEIPKFYDNIFTVLTISLCMIVHVH